MSDGHISSKTVVARKSHLCHGCLLVYPAGTTMRVSLDKIDGSLHETRTCPTCASILMDADPYDFDEGFFPGDIRDNGPEAWEETRVKIGAPLGTGKVDPIAKAKGGPR